MYFDDEIKEKKEEKNYVPTVKMPCGRILIGRPGEPYYETITRYGYYKDGLDESDLDLSCENEVQYLQTKKGVPEGIFVIDRKGENNMEEQLETNVQENTEYNSHTIDDTKWATHIENQLTNSDTRIEYMPPEITRQPTTDQKIENFSYINTVKITVKKRIQTEYEDLVQEYEENEIKQHVRKKYQEDDIDHFFDSLLENVVFDMGFKELTKDGKRNRYCWCPCGKAMKAWRVSNHLEGTFGDDSNADCEHKGRLVPTGKYI